MPIINISNTEEIHYQLIDGDKLKPCLIFLHEGLGCIGMWKGFPASLCKQTGCRGLVYDRVGYGKSSAINATRSIHYLHEYALNELPRIIEEVIPNLPFIVVGHSDGASIGLIYGAQQSKYLFGIISLAAHVMVENETCRGIALANEAWQANKLNGLYKYHGEKTTQTFNAWADTWLQPWFKYWSIEYLLPSIEVPILALQGASDQYATNAQLQSIEKLSSGNVYTHLIKDSAHSPHLDATEEVTLLISNFITSLFKQADSSSGKSSTPIKVIQKDNQQDKRES